VLKLTVPFGELEDGDERQLRGGDGRLTASREQVAEGAVFEDGPQLVTEGQLGMAFREGGVRDAGGILGNEIDGEWMQRHGGLPQRERDAGQLPGHNH